MYRGAVSRLRALIDLLTPGRAHRYGAEHRSQAAELHLPRGRGPHPVVVLIHGGSWSTGVSKIVMRPIARALVRSGYAVWNIEYRRMGGDEGGGWPATFADVAAAVDHLAELHAPLDLQRVTIYGHSAGGHLALWAASRGALPLDAPGAAPRVRASAAISAAGANDLAQCAHETPDGAVAALMGGSPDAHPDRYALGDPIALVPVAIPVLVIHGVEDRTVSVRRSRNYAQAARARGASVEEIEIEPPHGTHRSHAFPSSASFAAVRDWLARREQ